MTGCGQWARAAGSGAAREARPCGDGVSGTSGAES